MKKTKDERRTTTNDQRPTTNDQRRGPCHLVTLSPCHSSLVTRHSSLVIPPCINKAALLRPHVQEPRRTSTGLRPNKIHARSSEVIHSTLSICSMVNSLRQCLP